MTDGRISRTELVALGASGVCAFLDLYATQPLLPEFERMFHATKAHAAWTVSASTLAVALAAPFIGLAADRLGRKRVIVPAMFALSVPTFLAATSTSLATLIVWRFLQGLVLPAVFAVTIAYVTEEFAGRGVGTAMAALVTGNVIGGFAGRIIAGLVADASGWRVAFVVLGLLNVAGGVMTWRWLPAETRFVPHRTPVGQAVRAMGKHLANPRLVATYAVGFSVLFSLVATFTYVTFYLAEPPFSLGTAVLSSIFVVYLVGVFVTPVAGRWIDRYGSRRSLSTALAISVAAMPLTLTHSLPLIALGLAVCSSAVFVCQSASTSYLQHAAPAVTRSSAAGLYVAFYYLGGSIGGEVPGLLWRWAGWPGCVALVILAQLATIAVAWRRW
jgi:MFS transporter, YNFM family, putative membrane transport protein